MYLIDPKLINPHFERHVMKFSEFELPEEGKSRPDHKPEQTGIDLKAMGVVDYFYQMDPSVENIARDGTYLKDGMVVLVESIHNRVCVYPDRNRYETDLKKIYTAKIVNRWCEVTELYIEEDDRTVTFVGVYSDGFQAQRRYGIEQSWIFRKDDKFPEM
jgi:hypothetical protein